MAFERMESIGQIAVAASRCRHLERSRRRAECSQKHTALEAHCRGHVQLTSAARWSACRADRGTRRRTGGALPGRPQPQHAAR
jgi:hypothetical protein